MRCLDRVFLALLLAAFTIAFATAQNFEGATDRTPPRLSYIEGAVSFWRPGAEDWMLARVNTPLAPGDALYTNARTTLEIQVGARAFVRAAEKTHLSLVSIEPDFLRVEVTAGTTALDLRGLPSGYRVELDTPNAAFTIEHPGYYRADVASGSTHFITRRSGRATVSVGERPFMTITGSEELVVRGTTEPLVEAYVAPELDAWDRWNYARTEYELEALSRRYLSPGIYGAGELDRYGTWRIVPQYGPVWVPDPVAPGWAPYSAGAWVWDPYYGWTWLDDAAWGWAPYHYGRWVYVSGLWAWAPGPVIARPLYAPALVAFFGFGSGVSDGVGIGEPGVGWVALGWGEPLYPWWGPHGFIGVAWWGGWGGPRVVPAEGYVHHNARVPRAIVAVDERHFGRGPARPSRFTINEAQKRDLRPLHGGPAVKPSGASFAGGAGRATRPPPGVLSKPPLAARGPTPAQGSAPAQRPPVGATPGAPATSPHAGPSAAVPRPDFGEKGRERARPPVPPRYDDSSRAKPAPSAQLPRGAPVQPPRSGTAQPQAPRAATTQPQTPRAAPTQPSAPRAAPAQPQPPRAAPAQPSAPRAAPAQRQQGPRAAPPQSPRALPGRPANAVAPRGAQKGGGR
ncbi:MAG: DUF6600 domain-containing protein [Burkholderiales bacterium]